MPKELKYTQIPEGALRRVATPFKEIVKVFECAAVAELIEEVQKIPMELFLINQTSKEKVVERHFLIGLAIPGAADKFKEPRFYFAQIEDAHFERIQSLVNRYKKTKSIIWTPGQV